MVEAILANAKMLVVVRQVMYDMYDVVSESKKDQRNEWA